MVNMDIEEFRKQSKAMLEYIINYFESVSQKLVYANVYPGYLKQLLPKNAPNTGEPFEKIMQDFEKYVIPGLTHWQHPGFYAYFPCISSYPSIMGGLLNDALGCTSFNLTLCLAAEDLENIVLNWYGKMLGLPDCFLYHPERSGGGILQGTFGECVLYCMIAARQQFIQQTSRTRMMLSKPMLLASLVAYCGRNCHSGVQKAAVLSLINLRVLDTDEHNRLTGKVLAKAIKEDKDIGLIPFFVNCTIGAASGESDALDEIGPVCEEHGLWLNVDGSYGGNALVCPEYQHLLEGIECASSFSVNPAKWLMIHLNCSIVFAKDILMVSDYTIINRTVFRCNSSEEDRCYQSNKAFRPFQFWIMIRSYGVERLQKHIRNHIQLAQLFGNYVSEDDRFEVLTCSLGIVCFRLKSSDKVNKDLIQLINSSGKLLMNSHSFKGKFAIRLIVCAERADEDDMLNAWTIIREFADQVLTEDFINDSEDLSNAFSHNMP